MNCKLPSFDFNYLIEMVKVKNASFRREEGNEGEDERGGRDDRNEE